ncbi:hypothetical protein SAMN05216516_105164 [Izhakiella capsodis]|uniref:Uncharacterized protein n=1 Tax=Izhakiella capsodis TaxID=1367852 RepID=A0A1I4Y2F8_9GAMM|nr:hypothetical protein SAMN05216516_105164 [Izhakiella capsodis]
MLPESAARRKQNPNRMLIVVGNFTRTLRDIPTSDMLSAIYPVAGMLRKM